MLGMFTDFSIECKTLTDKDCEHEEIGELEVNYDQPLWEMVDAGGYSYPNWEDISMGFPRRGAFRYYKEHGIVKVRAVLVRIRCAAERFMVREYLARSSMRCAKLPELLTLGYTYPERQRKRLIVCLDNSIEDKIAVLYTNKWGERRLGLPCSEGWPFAAGCSFLAIVLQGLESQCGN